MTYPISRAENDIGALVSARRLLEAADLARATLDDAALPGEIAARIRILFSTICLLTGDPQSLTTAEAVLALGGLSDDLYDAATFSLLSAATAQGDDRRAEDLAEVVLGGSVASHGNPAMIGALTTFALIAWREGRVTNALTFLSAAVQRSGQTPLRPGRLPARFMLVLLLTTIGRFDEADDLVSVAEREPEQASDAAWLAGFPLVRARLDLARERLDDAQSRAVRARDLAQEMGARTLLPNCDWMLATIALQRGEIDEAAARVAAYRADLHLIAGSVHTAAYVLTEAEVAQAQNDSARASAALAPVYDDLGGHRLLLVVAPTAASMLTRRALGLGDRPGAARVVAEAELLATANPSIACLTAGAKHARGLLDKDATALATAASAHLHPWARASASEDLGSVLAQTDGQRSRMAYEQAAAAYASFGATRDATRVRTRLREGNTRRWQRLGAEIGEDRLVSLTETELRVATLVSQGLTNSQAGDQMFISRHTVGVHLRHIYRKLAVTSRVELTRVVVAAEG